MYILLRYFIALLLIFAHANSLKAQVIENKGNKYLFKDQVFKSTELAGILSPSEKATIYFNEAMKSRKTARESLVLSGLSLGASIALFATAFTRKEFTTGIKFGIAGLGAGMISTVFFNSKPRLLFKV